MDERMSARTRGLYLEEFEIGHAYVSRERVITAEDVAAFAEVSGDHNPLHTDPAYGAQTIFGKCIAHGDVVVIDDNFGIRISEIVRKPSLEDLT